MGKPIIYVNSITYANKGQSLLSSQGIVSYIERNRDPLGENGCGYGLRVHAKSLSKALQILKSGNVRILRVDG